MMDSRPCDVLELATIQYIGEVFFQLTDGRMFATVGGKSLISRKVSYAVPATAEYRAALREKEPASV
jgi:hypothetical protein